MDHGTLTGIFVFLYPLAMALSMTAYGPQIHRLVVDPESAENYVLSTWVMWACGNFITTGYAWLRVSDLLFTLTSLFYLALNLTVILLVLFNRTVRIPYGRARMAAAVHV